MAVRHEERLRTDHIGWLRTFRNSSIAGASLGLPYPTRYPVLQLRPFFSNFRFLTCRCFPCR